MLNFLLVIAAASIVFYLVITFAPRGYRTIAFNAVSAIPLVGGELASVLTGFDWGKVVGNSQTAALIGLAVLVANIVLRTMTTGPVGGQE